MPSLSHVNPLLAPSALPYFLPDFASIAFGDYKEAIEQGFAEHRAEVEAIATDADEPTFENTVVALERSGDLLERAFSTYWTVLSADGSPEMRAYQQEVMPALAAHQTAIQLDPRLWARIDALHERAGDLGLDDEGAFLLERHWTLRKLAGASLDEADRVRVAALNERIAGLQSRFATFLLDDTNDGAVPFATAAELDGLSEDELSACAQAATARGREGFLVDLLNFTNHPYLASLTSRDSRRRIFDAQRLRGHRGNQWDTESTVLELVALRAELASIFGYPNHVAHKVADDTARTPEAIEKVVYPMAAPARANAERELASLQAEADRLADQAGEPHFALEAWDWSFYAELVRARAYDLDTGALRPWFEYNRVLVDGVFFAATKLYGVTFTERPDLSGWNDDVRVFEVFNEDGSALGLFLHDVYTRDSKNGGAWMNNLVDQSHLLGRLPVVCNNLNVPKPAPGQPTLLTLDNVTTMFHEFGHALHGLFSDATFPSLGGTNTSRDFVEFPSQVNEMWITWPEVIGNYARHHVTGEALPAGTLDKLAASELFNEGFRTVEYLASALLDQEWHKLAPGTETTSVDEFEAAALARIGLDLAAVPPRYSTTYFAHTFGGGDDGAYYAYIWSEVLDADTVEWFKDHGGLTRANGDFFRAE
ncbi:MAG TPA: M3 family metallopeptidase, partial [Propionibacteriaceae bacterium]|nr:M3 family metallopeptidase [Propionibacteriaceae bacterium]